MENPNLTAAEILKLGLGKKPSTRRFTGEYADNGKETRRAAREAAGNKCIRCQHSNDYASGHVLTTHHFDGDKANDEWWNLMALCQRCHLKIQGKVDPRIPWFLDHSEWIKPYVAGFYAQKYEGRSITREEAMRRMPELLAYEQRVSAQNELRRTEAFRLAINAHQDGDTARLEAIAREIRGLEGKA